MRHAIIPVVRRHAASLWVWRAAEEGAPLPEPEAKPEPAALATRTINGHGRTRLPKDLPRKRIEHPVPPEELACPECGAERERIGEEVTEQLEYIPSSACILEHVRPKYALQALPGTCGETRRVRGGKTAATLHTLAVSAKRHVLDRIAEFLPDNRKRLREPKPAAEPALAVAQQ